MRFPYETQNEGEFMGYNKVFIYLYSWCWYYLPTPPLGQEMTQGQFLSGV